ncbi:bifunctional folylpolyglutamate synthase/dihydrofolate synthase [Acetobacter sp. AN02]|uniref:bifunctional folylpolyglutamate synthase/dihydrofolate synthase n=1 Tax=Acetobacter sp. AN02 TaxID=2894186 RepID=UPI0024342479|nr:bifunctional folylpolyglutamate synthase/dihydrofolate synthase [Acetobacter sp. AN02]MDG6094944.1 bifunctional folylpolyglutamate synthase/dihydrofolate synthase [Acetobacter sp. AN02]
MGLSGGGTAEFTGRTGQILDRLNRLYPALIDLSLGRLEALLARLGHPEERLPPVIHVAGTNGKGSTCATLRAIGEAAGWRVHVMTSPHLIDVRERFRLAGKLVSEDELIAVLEEIERVNDGAPITVFEVLTAAGFLLFSRSPAELAVIEVGLGGRFDATNVLRSPAACAITPVSMDHEAFLGRTIGAIAREKAGIMKPGIPVVCGRQMAEAEAVFAENAAVSGVSLRLYGQDWRIETRADGLWFEDAGGGLDLPLPSLPGAHQAENAGLAVAALRASGLEIPAAGWGGIGRVEWPARLQRLHGRLAAMLPGGWELWLDGGHNPGAGEALARQTAAWADRPLVLIAGMKQTKDASGFLRPLLERAETAYAVAEPDQHLALTVEEIVVSGDGRVQPGPTVAEALTRIREQADLPGAVPGRVLICGSLYLAGVVLRNDGWEPV